MVHVYLFVSRLISEDTFLSWNNILDTEMKKGKYKNRRSGEKGVYLY